MAKPMPGGAADKAGNLNEHLWTALRLAEMLQGKARRIRLEPIGEAGTGIEFELVDDEGVVWVEQVKSGTATWTPRRLRAKGVLAAAKLQVERGRRFRFVALGAGAVDLDTLTSRSRQSESVDEFVASLSQDDKSDLGVIVDSWKTTHDEAWRLLRGIHVDHHTIDDLRRIANLSLRLLYTDDPDLVRGELRNLCDEHMHRELTAQVVRDRLESQNFTRRLIRGDHNVSEALHESLARHQRRIEFSVPAFGLVSREDANTVVDKLCDPQSGQVVVIDGRAGSGKSTVACEAATLLEGRGWHVAAARMDMDGRISTAAQLGRMIELDESPTVLLAGVADGEPSLLFIDQLDAVSTYSGRMSDNFDAVAEVITEVKRAPNIKVLLVTRTVDLEADPRLRALLDAQPSFGRHTVGDLGIEDVTAVLEQAGVPVPSSETTLRLLCTPLHLSVFSRLSESARSREYSTLQQLYEQYTEEARFGAEQRAGELDWVAITAPIVEYMNEREVLAVPVTVLDGVNRRQIRALESESVLVRDETRYAFFHESYFDFLFARSFVTRGNDLRSFLLSDGQALFRRAQTRQVLEHLLATDQPAFYRAVVDLLGDVQIRSHIKALVVNLLRQVPAESADWAPLDPLAWSDSWLSHRIVGLLRQPGWFDAADDLGRWERWLDDAGKVEMAFSQLVIAARTRPLRVVSLLKPRIERTDEWCARLASLVSFSLRSELVEFTLELVELGYLDKFGMPLSGRQDIWWSVYSMKAEDPVGATRLVGAILQRGLARARAEGGGDPFETRYLPDNSQLVSCIADVAKDAPGVFVTAVLPFVIEVAMVGQQQHDEFLPVGRRWGHRLVSSNYAVGQIVFNATDAALRHLAVENPAACAVALEPILATESAELRFLACRALEAGDDHESAVEWLVSDPRNLRLGWEGSNCWASRSLIEKHSPRCPAELFARLEESVLGHAPEFEKRHRRWRGREKYDLLSAFDPYRLSPQARGLLGELQRRFPESPPAPPRPVEAYMIGSPIEDDAATVMTDENWLRALRKHTSSEPVWDSRSERSIGGARQLAQQLGGHAQEAPERFAELAMQFDDDIPAVAMDDVLTNVAKYLGADKLADLCRHARDVYGEECGLSICRAICDAPTVNPRLVKMLRDCAVDADPDHEVAQTIARSGDFYYGGELFTAGMNSTRGEAGRAIARVLFLGSDHVDDVTDTVEALAEDPIMAVRACAAEAVNALARHLPQLALDIAHRLLGEDVELLDAPTVQRLLQFAVLKDPDRFGPYLAAALAHGGEISSQAGRIWAIARWHDRMPTGSADDFGELSSDARRGAAAVYAHSVSDCLDDLTAALADDESAVRSAAAEAVQYLDKLDHLDAQRLIEALLGSPVLSQAGFGLLHSLARREGQLPASSLDMCERVVETTGTDIGDIRTSSSLMGRDLVALVLRLYREGTAPVRTRCLDIVDRLVEFDVYEAMEAIDEER